MEKLLEYLAFGSSLTSAFLYGKRGYKGPIAGLVCSVFFIFWGFISGVYAAVISNLIFFVIHGRNLIMTHTENPLVVKQRTKQDVERLVKLCHSASVKAGWWHDLDGNTLPVDVPLKLCLIHSEISEGMGAHRRDAKDNHLPHREGLEVELADAVIRIFDLAGALGYDLGGAIAEKMEYNDLRPDHKVENRRKGGGKKY